jgi:hypothetical protein
VKITKAGQSDINATSVVWVSSTKLTCIFPITGAVVGTWTIVVTNPDTTNGSLADGFTVNSVSVGGCSGPTKGLKFERSINLGIRVSGGAGSARPTSGQIYPRGQG